MTNWKVVQAEHHSRKARLLSSLAAAFEGEANWAENPRTRAYLFRRARALRSEAASRSAKAEQLASGA